MQASREVEPVRVPKYANSVGDKVKEQQVAYKELSKKGTQMLKTGKTNTK